MRTLTLIALTAAALTARAGETIIAQSGFDAGPEGWTFPVSAGWDPGMGNPGGCLYGAILEPKNITARAEAPAAFLGDWSALDGGAGELRFDFALVHLGSGGQCGISPLSPRIAGPGGVASWNGPQFTGPVPFATYIAAIHPDEWTVQSGDWAALLAEVVSLSFPLELVCNTGPGKDLNILDNVRLVLRASACGPADLTGEGVLDLTDIIAFVTAFGAQEPAADFAEPFGVFDLADVIAFVAAFEAGCP